MKRIIQLMTVACAFFQAGAWCASGVPATITILQGDGQTAAVNKPVAGVVCVQVKDSNGNPIPSGTTVTFVIASGGGSVTGGTPTTDSNGISTLGSWTLGTAPGSNTLSVTCGAAPAITFTATATAGAPATLAIVQGDNQSAAANTAVTGVLCVQVKDSFGNIDTGTAVTFTVATGGGSVTNPTPSTDGSGIATLSGGNWTLGPTAGTNTISVTCGAAPAITFTATATVAAVPAKITIVAGNSQSAPVNTPVSGVVCVKITDSSGKIVPVGTIVNFAVASGGGSITGANPTTDASGIATLGGWTMGPNSGTNTLNVMCGVAPPITFTANGTPAGSAPTITSQPMAMPNPATVGTTVSFTVVATGTKLTYAWDFGDGARGSGATSTHSYIAPGTYLARVSISDSVNPTISATVSVTVNAAASVVGFGSDSDGDGFSDAFETAVNTDASVATSTPTGQPITAATLQTLTLAKTSIKLNFVKSSADAIVFSGMLNIPTGFNPNGANVYFDVGGVAKKLTLSAKGSAKLGSDSVSISIKSGRFSVAFTKGDFVSTLANSGLTNNTESSVLVSVPFTLIFNNTVYQSPRVLVYKAKKGKTGAAN